VWDTTKLFRKERGEGKKTAPGRDGQAETGDRHKRKWENAKRNPGTLARRPAHGTLVTKKEAWSRREEETLDPLVKHVSNGEKGEESYDMR